jgi:hypothetical protein
VPHSASTRVTRPPCRLAEDARDADHHVVAGFDEILEAGLHAAAAGRGERDGQPVLRSEEPAQPRLYVVHAVEKRGIEVPDERIGHRGEHVGMRIRGTGTE